MNYNRIHVVFLHTMNGYWYYLKSLCFTRYFFLSRCLSHKWWTTAPLEWFTINVSLWRMYFPNVVFIRIGLTTLFRPKLQFYRRYVCIDCIENFQFSRFFLIKWFNKIAITNFSIYLRRGSFQINFRFELLPYIHITDESRTPVQTHRKKGILIFLLRILSQMKYCFRSGFNLVRFV